MKKKLTPLQKMLADIRKRPPTGKGIGLKAGYVATAADFISDLGLGSEAQFAKALKDAQKSLVFRSDELPKVVKGTVKDVDPDTQKKSCMILDCIITSKRQDRDGDILMPKGAQLDPLMPLLWQHIAMMPIGKYLGLVKRDDTFIKGRYAIADTELGRDSAVLVDFGALRISHGFQPNEYEPIDEKEGRPGNGWKVTKFEVMEASLVSIPSNPDAVITAYSREKLHHPMVKGYAKGLWDKLPKSVRTTYTTKAKAKDKKPDSPVVVVINQNGAPTKSYKDLDVEALLKKAGLKTKGKSHIAKDDDDDDDDGDQTPDRDEVANLNQLRDDLNNILQNEENLSDDARSRIHESIQDLSELIGAQNQQAGVYSEDAKDDDEDDDDADDDADNDSDTNDGKDDEDDNDDDDDDDDMSKDDDDDDADDVPNGSDPDKDDDDDDDDSDDDDDDDTDDGMKPTGNEDNRDPDDDEQSQTDDEEDDEDDEDEDEDDKDKDDDDDDDDDDQSLSKEDPDKDDDDDDEDEDDYEDDDDGADNDSDTNDGKDDDDDDDSDKDDEGDLVGDGKDDDDDEDDDDDMVGDGKDDDDDDADDDDDMDKDDDDDDSADYDQADDDDDEDDDDDMDGKDDEDDEDDDDDDDDDDKAKEGEVCAMCGGKMTDGVCADCGHDNQAKDVGDVNGDLDDDTPDTLLDKPKSFSVSARNSAWQLMMNLDEGKRVSLDTLRQVVAACRKAMRAEVKRAILENKKRKKKR